MSRRATGREVGLLRRLRRDLPQHPLAPVSPPSFLSRFCAPLRLHHHRPFSPSLSRSRLLHNAALFAPAEDSNLSREDQRKGAWPDLFNPATCAASLTSSVRQLLPSKAVRRHHTRRRFTIFWPPRAALSSLLTGTHTLASRTNARLHPVAANVMAGRRLRYRFVHVSNARRLATAFTELKFVSAALRHPRARA